ncbi:MAG: ferredoxin [Bacillota bacterium]
MLMEVDQDLCISCGACIDICPEVFTWNDDDKAEAVTDVISPDVDEQAREAAESCPTDAIKEH